MRNLLWSAAALAGLYLAPSSPATAGEAPPAGQWQTVVCPFDTSAAKLRVECGWLTVPENYAKPTAAKDKIFAMIIHSPAPDKRADPVFFINGGPGAPGTYPWQAGLSRSMIVDTVGKRDWIVFDQRGNGRSQPHLGCDLSGEGSFLDRVGRCRDGFQKASVDLSQFNSANVARDAEALRKALGIKSWNLYGSSYGSRIALNMARMFPSSVRAIVHDSGLLPQSQPAVDDSRGAEVAVQRLIALCAGQPRCASRYPDLKSRFEGALTTLSAQTLTVDGREYDDARAAGDVRNLLFAHNGTADFTSRAAATISLIGAIASLDPRGIAAETAKANAMNRPLNPAPPEGRSAYGGNLSVNCNEERPFQSVEEIAAARTTPLMAAWLKQPANLLGGCQAWASGRALPVENQHVVYKGPQLALTGEFDASLSINLGREIVRLYPGAREILFRNASHTQLRRDDLALPTEDDDLRICAATIANAFYDSPKAPLDASCAERRKLELVR